MAKEKSAYERLAAKLFRRESVEDRAEDLWRSRSKAADSKLTEYEKYKQAGGSGLSSLAASQLGSKDFYTADKIENYSPEDTARAFLDQQAFKKKFREEGVWDVEGNSPSAWSNKFLAEQIPALVKKLAASQQADANWAATSEQAMADYERQYANAERWKQLYAEKDRGYSGETMDDNQPNTTNVGAEEAAKWYNWLMADYLLGDQAGQFDFDAINQRYDAMSDEEYYAEEARLKQQFDSLAWDELMNPVMPTYESETESLQEALEAAQKEQEARKTWTTYVDLAEQTPGTLNLEDYYASSIEDYDPQVYSADRMANLVYFINHQGGSGQQFNVESMMQGSGLGALFSSEEERTVWSYYDRGYNYLLPDEIVVYNDLYATDPAIAQGFLDSLESELLQRKNMVKNAETEVLATSKELSVPMWMAARAAGITDAVMAPVKAYQALTGEDNPYNAANAYGNMVQQVGAAQEAGLSEYEWANKLGTIGGKNILQHLYAGGTSAADNALRLGLSGGNTAGVLGLAGLGSASTTLQELSARDDMSGAAKVVQAGLTGGLEVLTEKIGLDNLFKTDVASAGKYLLNSMGAEIGEEVLNAIGQEGIDQVVAAVFDHKAELKSAGDQANDLLNTIVQTAISSLLMGAGGAAGIAVENYKTGKNVRSEGDQTAIVELSTQMAPETESYKLGQEIKAHGGKVSLYKLGQLTSQLERDLGEERSRVINEVTDEAIANRLMELGDDENTAKKNAPAVRKVYRGQDATAIDRAGVAWNKNASQVVRELATETQAGEEGRVGQSWKSNAVREVSKRTQSVIGKQTALVEAMTSKSSTTTATTKATERAKTLTKGKPKIQAREFSYADDQGNEATGTFEKVTKKDGQIYVTLRTKGKEAPVEVSADSLTNAGNEGLATIIEYAAYEARHDMSAEEVNTLAATYAKQGGDAGAYIRQFEKSYLAGYSGITETAGDMDAQLSRIAYEQGQREAAADEEKRIEKTKRNRRNENPRVTWLGEVEADADVRGTGDEAALEEEYDNLTEGQQMVAEFSRHLAEQTGLNVVLFRSKARGNGEYGTQNGSYDSATHTIYLDVNAGNLTEQDAAKARKEGTLGYAIMRTMGHEVTHAIEATSPTFYAQYREAVKRELQKAGKDWTGLVRAKLDSAVQSGEKLTYGGAVAEVVADASEYMLQDSAFVNNLDTSLKGKVKAVIQDFAAKIKAAFRNLTGGSEEARALRNGMGQYSERLQRLWDAALVEMQAAGEEPVYRQFSEEEENAGAFESFADEAEQGTVQYSSRAQDQLEEDKYYTRAIDKWDGKASGGRMKVGSIKENSIYTAVGLPAGELYFDYSKAAAALSKHGDHLTKETLKQIPAMLASPIVITEPINQQVQNTVNVFGEMKGNNGKPIMVSIVMRPNRSGSALVDVIRTVEMRQDTDRLITEESVLYLSENKKRTTDWFQGLGNLSVPFAGTKSGFIRSISYSGGNVNGNIQKSAREQTETEAFINWFGNSEIVNRDGTPKIVYHTTSNVFTEFDTHKIGMSAVYASDGYLAATAHLGFWFNTKPLNDRGLGKNVMPVYLSAQRLHEPGTLDGLTEEIWDVYGQQGYEYDTEDPTEEQAREAGEVYRSWLESRGYDGVAVNDTEFGGISYVVFEPTQVKSATDNVGTFDPENPDIRYSRRTAEPDSASIREMLGGMQPTARMTETEKLLLKRYQEKLAALEEKEKQIEAQEQIIRTAPVPSDDLTKAKNRYQIYRTQANRIARELAEMGRNDGFARLMATSQEVVNRFLLGSAGSVADASNELDEEIADLTAQLKAAEADVTRTVSGQRTAFARGLFDQTQLNAAAKKLKDAYGSRMSIKTISDRLALVYGELYATKGTEGAQLFMAAAKDLAYDLLKQNKYRYKSEVLELIADKIGVISLSETDMQEIYSAGLTLSAYKKAVMPYIKVADSGSDLASYASNAEYYGDGALSALLGDETEGDMAMRLYNIIAEEKAKEREIGYEGMTEDQLIGEAMADIAGVSLPLSQDSKTVDYLRNELLKYAGENEEAAQKIEQAIKDAEKATRRANRVWTEAVKEVETAKAAVTYYRKLEEQRRLTEQVEQKQQITEQLKTEYAERLKEKVDRQRTEFREREQRAREYRHAREDVLKIRRRIGRNVKRLNALRMRATDQKHVPEDLNHVADLVMQTFTDSSLSRLAFSSEKAASLARRYRLLKELDSDATYYWDDEIETEIDNLMALSEAYNAIRERGAGVPSHLSTEGVKLENEILSGVDDIVSNVLQMIDSANDAFLKGRNETFEAFATQTGEKIRKKEDYKDLKGALGKAQKMLDEGIRTGNMTPVYFMEHLDSPELMDVFDEIRQGQSYYARIVAEGKAFVEQAKAKHHYGAWVGDGKLTMKTSQGHQIELTREEAAEIYAISKREAANKLYQTEHLLYGGFRYKDVNKKGKGLVAEKNVPHSLDAADIEKISRWLTDEQKAYADELVGFLSTTMADYGNEASMAMYGYKKFKEQYYIPFHTAAEQRFQRGDEGPQGENAGTGRLRNSGFTKKLQHKANATLIVGGLTDTASEHIHKMATYAAMVEPVENMKRLLNHKVMEPDGTVNTIRALIGQKYGQASQDYMAQLLKDLNGAAMGDERATDLVNSMIGAFKRGAVMASASVVLQQPTAMARAMAYISPRYFAQNPFYRPGKGTWDEMMKYAGTAVIKDMGKFDVGMGLTATQYIADENLSAMEAYSRLKADSKWEAGKAAYKRALDWLTAAPGKADQWTWGLIWKAVKTEQAALHPDMDESSEAFLDMCGERFDDVIDHTQVYDSVITRSNLMRSKNGFHRMATSFMSEPTLSLNMLWDALTGKHSGTQRAKIIGSVITSQVLAGALAALAQAWNDDEDKRNWLERYADRATGNILDNLNPLSMIPYVSDLMSLFEGYEVERPDMSVIADVMDYTKAFFKAFEDGGRPTWKQTENFVGTLANLFGLPAKNISREIRRTYNLIVNSQWTAPDAFNVGQAMLENVPGYDSKNAAYYERIVAAELQGDTQKAEDYREYMLMSKMVSEDALKTGLKTAMQESFISEDADEDAAVQYLLKIGAETDENEAYWEVDKWKEMRDEGITAGNYRKYADYFEAVETGENLKAVIQEYLDHGVSKSTLASQITTQYKKRMQELYKTNRTEYANLQARILTAYQVLGYDREKKLKDVQAWLEDN